MIERLDLYRCEICGNLVEVILAGGGELVCCGQPMHKLEGKNEEEAMLENIFPYLSNAMTAVTKFVSEKFYIR